MSGPILALRAAILARIAGDAALDVLLGGAAIHDEPPRGAGPAYAVFGEASARDDSTGTERGHAQELAIVVWARPGRAAAALAAADRLAALLDDAPLTLVGHHLVQLRVAALDAGRDDRTGHARAGLRLRAVTEVAG